MPSHGMLYDGWGKEQLGHLSDSCSLVEAGYEREMNRFELALAIARRAKDNAYTSAQEAPSGVMSHGGVAYRPRKSHVVVAMRELITEVEATGDLAVPPPPPPEAAAGDARSAGGAPLERGAPPPQPRPSLGSLDGDGGAAKLEDLNAMLLADSPPVGSVGAAGEAGAAAGAAADVDGLEALLAGIADLDGLDEDFGDLAVPADAAAASGGAAAPSPSEAGGQSQPPPPAGGELGGDLAGLDLGDLGDLADLDLGDLDFGDLGVEPIDDKLLLELLGGDAAQL
uniref:Uncharacterized protein n=1 Tax=Emiliania huxleyi TaxID=2903 RepID=A0A7S3WYX6_EMIHU